MPGWKGLPCAPAAPRLFAIASEVPASNKAAATAIRADLVMLFSRIGSASGSTLIDLFRRYFQNKIGDLM
jgi:hypothetical protein